MQNGYFLRFFTGEHGEIGTVFQVFRNIAKSVTSFQRHKVRKISQESEVLKWYKFSMEKGYWSG